MEISAASVKALRELTGAGILDCKNVLLECTGDLERAAQVLNQRGFAVAEKKASRPVTQGIVEAYIHTGGKIGAMIEMNCETDFVARTSEFQGLAHELAMQVAAMSPSFISPDDIPEGSNVDPETTCLLLQPFIRDQSRTVQDTIKEVVAKLGENIKISRLARFEVGS